MGGVPPGWDPWDVSTKGTNNSNNKFWWGVNIGGGREGSVGWNGNWEGDDGRWWKGDRWGEEGDEDDDEK